MSHLNEIPRYNVYMNGGTEGRGTAILTKEGLTATSIQRLPTGRGIAAEINGTWIINIYAPSGAEKRAERGYFLKNDVPVLMPPARRDTILAGDFNSVIDKRDSTSQNNTSRALATLIRGCDLRDVWDTIQNQTGYIFYAHKAARWLVCTQVSQGWNA